MLTKQGIPTPALLLDLDKFEANLARMASEVKQAGKRLRPHAKAHKCVEIAKRQIDAGAQGLCVATVNEAELMAKAGIEDLLLTSPVADPEKIRRIVETGAMVVVDHARQVEWYQEAACVANVQVAVLIDLDVGDHRTGAASIDQALDLALKIDRASHLWLRGVQAYSVSGSHGKDIEERRRNSETTYRLAAEARAAMAEHGLHTDVTSGGSTGTWNVDLALPDLVELQAGSYALMDVAYRRLGIDFENAMTVLTTVISANHDGFVTVDGGFKAFATDRPFGPEPVGLPGVGYRWGGDEFGYLDSQARLGSRIEFLPPHCDPTVNLYDRIYACRGNNVEAVWPIMDRMRA
ncbi:MAG TPA: DSD1 family PLP-dependent enzyme [Bryobacteraceae bacterium]|nr:DSD1 family PLP-dependent enzyme [Bryobacteraceae bacterium]